MESRSRRRPGSRPPRGARRRRDAGADDRDGVDRISGLHDDLLLLILARLRSARDAARTSILSSRWSDLWRRLPELYFLNRISPRALKAALAMVAVSKLSVLHIADPDFNVRDIYFPADIASLLHTAAYLGPLELRFIILWVDAKDGNNAVELPCFARATSINLNVRGGINLALPAQGGEFPELERLSIGFCRIDTGALISRCPYLRLLELNQCMNDGPLKVHSTTIEELVVTDDCYDPRIRSIDIVAPVLKKFRLSTRKHKDFTMSLVAPMLENLTWNCSIGYPYSDLKIDEMWFVGHLESKKEESCCIVLRLDMQIPKYSPSYEQKLQEIFQFPKFSVLELNLETYGHVYEGMVLNLLRIHNGIRRLKLATNQFGPMGKKCTPNCPCDQPQNWRSQKILMDLEEVEIENYKVSSHEIDFMKLLFRCSPLTKVVVKLASYVSIRSKGFKEICNLFKANPSVECHVYNKCGKEVMRA